jgi:hypothetical protein
LFGIRVSRNPLAQGCQTVYFHTKNRNLGKFCTVLHWERLVYFMDIGSILRSLDIFYDHLVYFVAVWYIFPRVGTLHQEKSGNPALAFGCACKYIRQLILFSTIFNFLRQNALLRLTKMVRFRVARWHTYFQTKKSRFGQILEGLAMEDVATYIIRPFGLFYCYLVYFVTIWSILRLFGIFCDHLVYFVAIR